MKVIFLDIDGVLNTKAWQDDHPFCMGWEGWQGQVNPDLVTRLNTLLARTGATLILSSTWRFSWGAEEITDLLSAQGLMFPVVDVTPTANKQRGAAIFEWLNTRGQDVTQWIALDDDDLSELGPNHWVEVEDGLTELHLVMAEDLLA